MTRYTVFHFLFNLRHTTTIENIDVQKRNEQSQGWSRSHVMKKDTAGFGAILIKSRVPELEPEPWS